MYKLKYNLGLSRLGFKHPTFRLRGQRSNPLRHRRGMVNRAEILFIVNLETVPVI